MVSRYVFRNLRFKHRGMKSGTWWGKFFIRNCIPNCRHSDLRVWTFCIARSPHLRIWPLVLTAAQKNISPSRIAKVLQQPSEDEWLPTLMRSHCRLFSTFTDQWSWQIVKVARQKRCWYDLHLPEHNRTDSRTADGHRHFTIWSAVGMLRWFTSYSVINFIPLWEPISLISQNLHERQFLNSFVNRVHHSNDLSDQEHHTSHECGKVRQVPMAVGLFCLTFIPLCLNHKFSPMLEPDIAMTDP